MEPNISSFSFSDILGLTWDTIVTHPLAHMTMYVPMATYDYVQMF